MALTYDLRNVKDRDETDEGWTVTQGLIFTSMAIGMNRLTSENAGEFYARTAIRERLDQRSCVIDADGNTVYTTPENVHAHIGMFTNAVSLTRRQFMATITRDLERLMEQYDKEIYS